MKRSAREMQNSKKKWPLSELQFSNSKLRIRICRRVRVHEGGAGKP